MSSNLLKRGFTQLVEEDARVINTNDLVAKGSGNWLPKCSRTKEPDLSPDWRQIK
ncbi:MAG: hypothetical protein ACLTAX_09795 [Waltera sp.]